MRCVVRRGRSLYWCQPDREKDLVESKCLQHNRHHNYWKHWTPCLRIKCDQSSVVNTGGARGSAGSYAPKRLTKFLFCIKTDFRTNWPTPSLGLIMQKGFQPQVAWLRDPLTTPLRALSKTPVIGSHSAITICPPPHSGPGSQAFQANTFGNLCRPIGRQLLARIKHLNSLRTVIICVIVPCM